jgi:hypothetical protein
MRIAAAFCAASSRAMATIQEEILEEFYQRLEKTDGFTKAKVKQLRDLFTASKKPKAPDLMKVFSETSKENLP